MARVCCVGIHYFNPFFGSQESGMISNLSDAELSVPFPSEEATEWLGEPAAPDLDSPMSEPPASPTRTKSPAQEEEAEEAEISDAVETAAEVEFPTSHRPTPSLQRPSEGQEKEGEEEEPQEEEEEEEQKLPSDHRTSVPPSPHPPPCPASTSSHHSPAVSRHSSLFRSPPVPSPSPQPVCVQPVIEAVEMEISEPLEDIREESPQLMLPSSSPVLAQTTEIHVQSEDTSIDVVAAATPSPSPSPVAEIPPRPMVIHTAIDVVSIQPSLLIPTPTSPAPALPDFSFEDTDGEILEEPLQATVSTEIQHHHFNPNYNLPPLKALPPEYLRKGKSSKQKKKDKDKTDTKGSKEDWAPLGFAKWGAIIRANPIYKKVSRATKCLSTKDWGVRVSLLLLSCTEHTWLCAGRNYRAETYAYTGTRRIARECGEVEL